METINTKRLKIRTTVKAPIEKVWKYWSEPEHITQWCQASDDWHAPAAENDLRDGGKFKTRMEAKDGSFGFDFEGVYDKVIPHSLIEYTMADGRKSISVFKSEGDVTHIEGEFDPESSNPLEMQQAGWQAILDSFKKYTENH